MAKLTFYGGTGMVTGANFLLEIDDCKILIDCGLIQGNKSSEDLNHKEFLYEPKDIDYLIITHSHLDHIGRIPKLVKDGFRGKIISTPQTKEIAEFILLDAVKILDYESRRSGILPIYDISDISPTMALWDTLPYHSEKKLTETISLYFKDAGHILGSAMVEISHNNKKIVFTGDLGNSPSILLKDTEWITDADYILMESVYGDRNHPPKEARTIKLRKIISETVKNKRTLIIPAFSVERTQMIIYEMNEIIEAEKYRLPVFIDSPLAIKITGVYKKYMDSFNEKAQADIMSGDDIFNFPGLKFIVQSGESKMIEKVPNPKIIMAGSGMSVGGRVIMHESNYVSRADAEILFVGYQTVGSLGRQLQDGAKEVTIFGEKKKVLAKISSISGYSSHKDSDHLLELIDKAVEEGKLKKVFCVMGEPKSSMSLVQKIKDNFGIEAIYPELGQSVDIDL